MTEPTQEPTQERSDVADIVTEYANAGIEKAENAINSAGAYVKRKTKDVELSDWAKDRIKNARDVKEAATHPKETATKAVTKAYHAIAETETRKDQEFKKQKYRDEHDGRDEPKPGIFEAFGRGLSRTSEKSIAGSTESGRKKRALDMEAERRGAFDLRQERIAAEKKAAEPKRSAVLSALERMGITPREKSVIQKERRSIDVEERLQARYATAGVGGRGSGSPRSVSPGGNWFGLSTHAPLGDSGSGIKPGRGSPLSGTAYLGNIKPLAFNNQRYGNTRPIKFNIVAPDFSRSKHRSGSKPVSFKLDFGKKLFGRRF